MTVPDVNLLVYAHNARDPFHSIAIEHQAQVHSNDRDFERFPGLRLHNPLV